jgi:hypothetical protein
MSAAGAAERGHDRLPDGRQGRLRRRAEFNSSRSELSLIIERVPGGQAVRALLANWLTFSVKLTIYVSLVRISDSVRCKLRF